MLSCSWPIIYKEVMVIVQRHLALQPRPCELFGSDVPL